MTAPDAAELLDQLSEEFVARMRAGEAPSVATYAARHPELASEIEKLFPVLMRMEGFKEDVKQDLEAIDEALGTELGEYRLIREIGRGGMGVVYEAMQETLDRRVALKMLPSNLTKDPRFLERFRLEARAAGRLQHKNVVPVIGIGEHDGIHYFAMQYIEGRGLDELVADVRDRVQPHDADGTPDDDALVDRLLGEELREGSDPSVSTSGAAWSAPAARAVSELTRTWFDNAARLVLQASEGVAAAHARGILHRDIKPSNLMVDTTGKLWITDFGLCKEEGSNDLTRPGDMLGTLRYMPPERLAGESDVQGDIYGLGVTLYELLTLRHAYPGDDHAQLLASIANESPPRPRSLESRVPPDLEAIVLKATARDRKLRYATAEALAADLRAYLEGRPIAARPPSFAYHLRSAIRRHRALSATILVAFVALVASTAYYVTTLQSKEAATRFQSYVAIVAAGDAALDAHDVEAARRHLDAAPADHRGWEWQHVQSRFDRSLRTTDVGPGRVSDVAYHPAGDVFAAAAPNAVRIFDDSSGAELFRLETHGAPEALAWSPAGDRLAVRATRGVEIWSWPDRRRRVLIDATQRGEVFAWSGDGRRLAIGGDSGIVRVIAAESGRPVSSLQTRSRILSLDVHPTLPLVACGHWDGHASLWDLETGDARWTRRVGPQGLHDIAFLGDRFLVTPSELPHVHVWNVQDGSLHRTTSSRLGPGVNGVGIARDGRRLVLGSVIHLASYDAATFEPLVAWQDPLPFYALSVHPSGTRAATAGRGGRIQEWGLDPDADPTMLTGHIDDVWDVAYAPSGAFLVSGGIGVLRVWDARTGEQRRAWIGNRWTIMRVAVSPDSRTVAAGDRNGDVVLWDVATDTIRARLGGHGDFLRQIVFAPDGARLYVASGSGEIHVWDQARQERIVKQKVDGGGGALAVHPSGRWLAVGTADGRLELRDANTLERVWSVEAHEQMITRLVFDPRADRLITASEDGQLKVWRRKDGTLVRSREGGGILALAISPDGRRVATGGRDGAIRLWDPDTGQLVFTRGRLATWIPGLAFSPDGTQLAAAETTGRVRILDTVPIRERLRGHRETLARRERARQIVDGVHRTEKDTTRVIAMLRERDDLDPAMREAALREAYRRHGSADGLADYLWRAVARRRLGPIDRGIAWGLAADMVRAHGHRNVQDRRRTTLFGAVRARIGDHQGALATLKTASTFNEGREPGLFAVDLAFLTICHARLTQRADAVATLARLETHLERHPTLLDDRIVRFRDEAREAVARMKQR